MSFKIKLTHPRSSFKHRDSGMGFSITALSPTVVPIVKGIICVAPLENAEVNETDDFDSSEKELTEEEESSPGIAEPSTAKRDKRRVSKRRPFAFVKSLATAMQLSSRNRRKVGSCSSSKHHEMQQKLK